MRLVIGFFAVALTMTVSAEDSKSCLDSAQTQSEMSQCAGADYRSSDSELNRVYKLVQESYADDPIFLTRLKEAQKAWIKFRDAELAMMYPPHDEDPDYYGSVGGMCESSYLAELTLARVATLKKWLKGIPEGDVCSGSIKLDHQMEEFFKGRK